MSDVVTQLLHELVEAHRACFGRKLAGLYAYGSLVLGDFDFDVSDLDLLAVLHDDVTDAELPGLITLHASFIARHPAWRDRVDVQYLSTSALGSLKTRESRGASISAGEPVHFTNVGRHWLMNWWIVREKGRVLYGPDPKAIIEAISREEFLESVRDHVHSWDRWVQDMRGPQAQSYAILTLARNLYAVENGEMTSKVRGAEYAKSMLPQWTSLIDQALEWRRSAATSGGEDTFEDTVRFVTDVRERIVGSAPE